MSCELVSRIVTCCCKSAKLVALIVACFFCGSIQHILLALLAAGFSSSYFVLASTSVMGTVLYSILACAYRIRLPNRSEILDLCVIGIVDAMMCFAFILSADPVDTSPIFQSIFLSLTVLINAGLSKCILVKEVAYKPWFLALSVVLLVASFLVSAYPMFQLTYVPSWLSGVYVLAIFLNSLSNVLQERYLRATDGTLETKIGLACYTTTVQTIVVLAGSVVCLTGHCGTWSDIVAELPTYNTGLLVVFVIVCFVGFFFGTYLNEISSNYNMVLTTLTTQAVALFFLIVPSLNHGFQSPLVNTIVSIILSIGCVACWVYAEDCEEYETKMACNEGYGTF